MLSSQDIYAKCYQVRIFMINVIKSENLCFTISSQEFMINVTKSGIYAKCYQVLKC